MGTLTVDAFMTLDGVVQSPGGPEEDPSGGFRHGGWQFRHSDAGSGAAWVGDLDRAGALLLGRRTYDIFEPYWPTAGNDIAPRMNAIPWYVASRTRKKVGLRNAKLLGRDLAAEVRSVKDRHGEVLVFGSGDLVRSLLREGLVDRLNLFVYPLVLGTGKRLFAEGTAPTALKLVHSQAFEDGPLHLAYEPAGPLTDGPLGAEA